MTRCHKEFNQPEKSRHRKREIGNLKGSALKVLTDAVVSHCLRHFTAKAEWVALTTQIDNLVMALQAYTETLSVKNKHMKVQHGRVYAIDGNCTANVLPVQNDGATVSARFLPLLNELGKKELYQFVDLSAYTPPDNLERHRFLKALKEEGLPVAALLCSFSYGGNITDYSFIWKVTGRNDFNESLSVVNSIKKEMPIYHPRAMRTAFIRRFGSFVKGSSSHLRAIFNDLTNTSSAASNLATGQLDVRLDMALDAEDPDILVDLREMNGNHSDKYSIFWTQMQQFVTDQSAVDDRRQSEVSHMAVAFSVRDLVEQVTALCPPDTPIPSHQWVRYQFHPKHPNSKEAQHYTKRFNLRLMVQQRQLRMTHEDSHYCSAYFRYLREFAILYKQFSTLVSLDDKHRIKCGEPGLPVAAVERGREVIVCPDHVFSVADHDFTKVSLIPSVQMLIKIPDNIDGSFYEGSVYVGMKESAFEASSGLRHSAELYNTLVRTQSADKPILLIYSDGGPDHNNTFASNQLALIGLFLLLDLDMLVAMRTAPHHSWRNPVERVMSGINIGLQSIGIMRAHVDHSLEDAIKNASNVAAVRQAVEEADVKEQYAQSLQPPKALVSSVIERLVWTGQKMSTFTPATNNGLSAVWDEVLSIDPEVPAKPVKKDIQKSKALTDFINHCCTERHYSFTIKKCGVEGCGTCRPVKMDAETFQTLSNLPDPIPDDDGVHFKSFSELYGSTTTEVHRPSKNKNTSRGTLAFNASVQHVINCDTVICCEECDIWRVVYSKKKLDPRMKEALHSVLDADTFAYTCGHTFEELQLPPEMDGHTIAIKAHACHDKVETLYYGNTRNDIICIYCACLLPDVAWELKTASTYPKCTACSGKNDVAVKKRKQPANAK